MRPDYTATGGTYFEEHHREFSYFIDPAGGSGNHGLTLQEIPFRIGLDINLRALAYSKLNAILAGVEGHLLGLNDISLGFPQEVTRGLREPVLIGINMPFAIMANKGAGDCTRLAQDGGDRGIHLTLAGIRAVAKLARENMAARPLQVVVLCYSLVSLNASREIVRNEVVEQARTLLPDAAISFSLLRSEKLWRVNGKKEEPNPMPVERMETSASCRHTFADNERDIRRQRYEELAKLFVREGFNHLAYGIVDIRIG